MIIVIYGVFEAESNDPSKNCTVGRPMEKMQKGADCDIV